MLHPRLPCKTVLSPSCTLGAVASGAARELAEQCFALLRTVELDATALPIHALSFEAHDHGVTLTVDMRVPDRNKAFLEWTSVHRVVTCPWAPIKANGPEYLLHFLRETVTSALAHEVSESLLVTGVRVFDPHRTLLAMRLLADPPKYGDDASLPWKR